MAEDYLEDLSNLNQDLEARLAQAERALEKADVLVEACEYFHSRTRYHHSAPHRIRLAAVAAAYRTERKEGGSDR